MRDPQPATSEEGRDLLRVAFPSTRNAQQTPGSDATGSATSAQQTGLKALARKVLERNNQCNKAAAAGRKDAQQVDVSGSPVVASASAAALQAFIDLVRITAACEHGRLLHRDVIWAELHLDDVAELLRTDRVQRQQWAAMLAFRLTRLGSGWVETR